MGALGRDNAGWLVEAAREGAAAGKIRFGSDQSGRGPLGESSTPGFAREAGQFAPISRAAQMIPAGAFMDFFRILRRKGLTKPRLRCRIGERKCRAIWVVRGSAHEEAPARPAEVYEERGTCCSIAVRIRLWGGVAVLDQRCRAALRLESRPGAITRLSNIAGGFRICSSPQRKP